MKTITQSKVFLLAGLIFLSGMSLANVPKTENTQDKLTAAYQREYAFLSSQKRMLKKRAKELKNQEKQLFKDEDINLKNLRGALLALTKQNQTIERNLIEAEKSLEKIEDNNAAVEQTIFQMESTLKRNGMPVKDLGKKYQKRYGVRLDVGYSYAYLALLKSQRILKEKGEFFLKDGKKVKGEILTIGKIAKFGKSGSVAGALYPVGDNKFKLWSKLEKTNTIPMFNGKNPEYFKGFIFENSDKGITEKKEKTFLDMVHAGGSIAWVIVGLGIVAFLLIVVRAILLKVSGGQNIKHFREIEVAVSQGNLQLATEKSDNIKGSLGRVLNSTVKNLHEGREKLEDIINENILHEINILDRFGSITLVLAAVAPLLGLLGTVTGMISTFDIITEFGTGDPKLLSSGISEALITTKLGLMVAIPTLLIGNVLGGWSERIKNNLEKSALRVTNLFFKKPLEV